MSAETKLGVGKDASKWWWLSFASSDLPEGQQFLGVALVFAPSFLLAVTAAHANQCNPGGEVMAWEIPWCDSVDTVPEKYRHRLLTKSEADEVAECVVQLRSERSYAD